MIKGMVNGLYSGQGSIVEAAKDVAKAALKAAMKALGIASPSKETYWIGQMFDEGAAVGIRKTADVVTSAAAALGEDSIYALKKTLTGVNELIKGDLDMTPVISPVLDLTGMQRTADQIGGMFRTQTISLNATTTAATDASAGWQENQDILNENASVDPRPDVSFTQINNSPKALSEEEIYRNTRNQLSIAKGAVNA